MATQTWHRLQILLTEGQYVALTAAAKERRASLGALVREALGRYLGDGGTTADRLAIVHRMARYDLPVADWPQMEAEIEAVRASDDILP